MHDLSLEQKQQQFDEFFSIKHPTKVNLVPLAEDFVLPNIDALTEVMPYAFRVASEISDLDVKALRPLRALGDKAEELAAFLNHQSKKIDLMMSFVLQQQDDEQHRYEGIKFGGGGVIIANHSPMEPGLQVELKIFINEEATAIFCYGEVIACQQQDDEYHITLIFTRIREQDQETLVRASLHMQTQQLRKRAKKENN